MAVLLDVNNHGLANAARITGLDMSGPGENCSARHRAYELMKEVVTEGEWWGFVNTGLLTVRGSRGVYRISPWMQTVVEKHGRAVAYSCIQLVEFAPVYDRMIAEYLLLKNDEERYWRIANIFERKSNVIGLLAFWGECSIVALAVWLAYVVG